MSRKIAILLLAAVMIAWSAICAFAQESDDATAPQANANIEPLPQQVQFVPPAATIESFAGGELSLRPQATIPGPSIQIKNICRWTDADAAFFAPVADLTVTRFSGQRLYAVVTLDEVRQTLSGAGMNMALVSLGGASTCDVNRPEATDADAMQEWLNSHNAEQKSQQRQVQASIPQIPAPVAIPAAAVVPPVATSLAESLAAEPATGPFRSLRDVLAADLAGRLQVDPADIELSYNSADSKVLRLVEPYFQFAVTPSNVSGLGDVSWNVEITATGPTQTSAAASMKTHIEATASLWETQTILQTPLGFRQVIRDQDLLEKRVLVQRLPAEALLTKNQAVGQETSRELKPGTVLTASMVDPALLARPGQVITVSLVHGSVSITAVARAMESGSYGQTIRARNDVDPTQVFAVTLTGPQEGAVTSTPDENKSPIAAAEGTTPSASNGYP